MTSEPTAAAVALPPGSWPSLEAEDRFARVVEASPTALVLAGRSGKIEMVNGQCERMFGYDRSALHGQTLELLLPQRFRHRHVGLRNKFFTAMSSRIMGEGQDLCGLRKDGTEFPLEIGLNPIDIDGAPMVLAGIIDVTARHEIAREQERQRLDLARSNTDLEEFAYAASHDLKAPLRGISHLVQWIRDDIVNTANAETLENLKLLQSRVSRMQMLLDGLLAYSRAGHTASTVEDVDTAEVVHAIFATLAPPPGFVLSCEDTLPVIRTHRMPIQAVLENLIGNGLKHHDRTEGRIAVSARLTSGVAEFRVTDDGPGIAAQFHDRIFLIFQTLTSRDDVESSGIGLTIVKKKVQSHGGHIWVERSAGTWHHLRVHLEGKRVVRDNTVNILLVDDDKVDVMAVKRSFRELKIANPVIEARNGIEALERLRGQNGYEKVPSPCLVLLDLNMPRMGGIEFLEELRRDESLRSTLVFVMTTSGAEEDRAKAYDNNVAGYVLKHRPGQSFLEAISMLEHYWKVVEFPD